MGFRLRSRWKRAGLVLLASVLLGLGVAFLCNQLPDGWAGYSAAVGDGESPAIGIGALLIALCGAALLTVVAVAWPFLRRALVVIAERTAPRRRPPRSRAYASSRRSVRETDGRPTRSSSGPSGRDRDKLRQGGTPASITAAPSAI